MASPADVSPRGAEQAACACCRWGEVSGKHIDLHIGDICDFEFLSEVFQSFQPDAGEHSWAAMTCCACSEAKMPFPGCLLLSALRPFRSHQPVADKLTGKISARRPARLCWQDLGRWLDLSHIRILYSCSQCLSWCFWMVGSTASMSPGLIRVPAMSESHGVTAVRHQLILQHLLASCTVLEGCLKITPSKRKALPS